MRIFFAIVLLISSTVFAQSQNLDKNKSNVPQSITTRTQPDFSIVDKNKDNRLSKDEFKAAGLSEQYFKKLDVNKDEYVDRTEYLASDGIALCC